MRKTFLLFISICISQIIAGQSLLNDSLNLNFNRNLYRDNWSSLRNNCKTELDSLQKKSGRASLFIGAFSVENQKSYCTLSQNIYLPDNFQHLTVSIYSKGDADKAYLKIFNTNNGKVDQADSIFLENSDEWEKSELHLDHSSSRILHVEVKLEGSSSFWIDQLEIKLDNKDLYKIPVKQIAFDSKTMKSIQSAEPLDTFSLHYEKQLSIIGDKKVIGIGESLHGSHEMSIWRNQLIKYLVQNENCKLVILEGPNDFVSRLDHYIQSQDMEEPTLVFDGQAQIFHYTEEMLELIRWLKNYNQTASKKVKIAGMDIYNDYEGKYKAILSSRDDSLLTRLNKIFDPRILHKEILNSKNYIINLLSTEKYDQLSKLVYDNICLYTTTVNARNDIRDSCMFENAKDLIANYTDSNEKTVICGHLEHMVKDRFSTNFTNLGSYLNNQYKNKYFVIAQLAGNGDYFAAGRSYKLLPPKMNSIESLCSFNKSDAFIIQTKDIQKSKNDEFLHRNIGGFSDYKQFYPITKLTDNFDALLFIKESTPLQVRMRSIQIDKGLPDLSTTIQTKPKSKPGLNTYHPNAINDIKNGIYSVVNEGIVFTSVDDSTLKMVVSNQPSVPENHFEVKRITKKANNSWELEVLLTKDGLSELMKATNESDQIALILNERIVLAPSMNGWKGNYQLYFTGFGDESFKIIDSIIKNQTKTLSK